MRNRLSFADDTHKVESLLRGSRKEGSGLIYSLAHGIATKSLKSGSPEGLGDRGLVQLSDMLAKTNATAHMMGRARMRQRMNRMQKFSEPSDWTCFNEPTIAPMAPMAAAKYFLSKVPMAANLGQFEAQQEGQAFQLAATTEKTLLQKIWEIIQKAIGLGQIDRSKPREIDEILQGAGIKPQSGYGDLVFDTNVMNAFRRGNWEEYTSPDVGDLYPVWQYFGIRDGRQRPRHKLLTGLRFPKDLDFWQVRGNDAANECRCRCDFAPIFYRDWERMQSQGAKLSTLADVAGLGMS